MSLKILNDIAGAMSSPKKHKEHKLAPSDHDGDEGPAPDHHMSVDEIQSHLCPDCESKIKRLADSRGSKSSEHA